jgi:hypothetical protein
VATRVLAIGFGNRYQLRGRDGEGLETAKGRGKISYFVVKWNSGTFDESFNL